MATLESHGLPKQLNTHSHKRNIFLKIVGRHFEKTLVIKSVPQEFVIGQESVRKGTNFKMSFTKSSKKYACNIGIYMQNSVLPDI